MLVTVEVVLRLVVPSNQLVFTYERPDGMLMHEAGSDTYLPRPLAEDVVPDGPNHWRWRMNADGLRADREYPKGRPPGTKRYLALGDSWIFGESADQSQTLEEALQVELRERLGAPVEVLNAGVPGAAAYDMLVRWRTLRGRWDLDGIVLGAPKNVGRQRRVEGERAVWYDGGGAPYVNVYLYLGMRRLLTPYTRARLRQPTADDWATMTEDTVLLAKEAKAAGLEVVLGLWPPDRAEAFTPDGGIPYDRFDAALAPLGVLVTGAKLASNTCWGFEDLAHPSEAGYRVLARILAERLAGGADPGGLRTLPRCEEVPGIGPAKADRPRTQAEADGTRMGG